MSALGYLALIALVAWLSYEVGRSASTLDSDREPESVYDAERSEGPYDGEAS